MFKRTWESYAIKAVHREKPDKDILWPDISAEQVQAHRDARLQDWETHIFVLHNPILVQPNDVKEIAVFKRGGRTCRVYPPFPLNEVEAAGGAFKDATIPIGVNEIASFQALPTSVVKGFTAEIGAADKVTYCRGIRVDRETGFPDHSVMKTLISQITQFTHQWWLRSPVSPFRGPLRLGAGIDKTFRPMTELKYHGAGDIESAWHTFSQTQLPLGFERPLTRGLWLLSIHNAQQDIPAEAGLLAFADAVAHYMNEEDERCVMDLAICFQILASKRQLADTGKTKSKLSSLLHSTTLASEETKATIGHLIIDRDHVAHGRPLHIVKVKEGVTVESYLEAVREVVSNFLTATRPGEWPKLAAIQLDSTRRR